MRQKSLSDEPQQIGYWQKALDERKKLVGAYWLPCVGMREIKQKERNMVPTYLPIIVVVDFPTSLVSGAYARVVLMPRGLR